MRRALTSTGLLLALGAMAPGAHAQKPSVTLQVTNATVAFGTANAGIYASAASNGGAKIDATPESFTLTAGFGLQSVVATVCVKSTGLTAPSSPAKPPAELEFSLDGVTAWTPIATTGTALVTTTIAPFGTYGAQAVHWRVLLRAGDVPNMATNRENWTGTIVFSLVLNGAPCP